MPDEGTDREETPEGTSSRKMWVKAATAAALGFELVGFAMAGVFVGILFDGHFDTSPVGLLVSLALAFVAAGWHIWRVSQRVLLDNDDE